MLLSLQFPTPLISRVLLSGPAAMKCVLTPQISFYCCAPRQGNSLARVGFLPGSELDRARPLSL